jgi:protein-S-isoprenylcysteine O-methyltransferase Ste14
MGISLKIYLSVYLVLYLLATFVVPTWRVWKQTGINPITFGAADTAHNFIGRIMKALIGLLVVAVAGWCAGGDFYKKMLPATYLEHPLLQTASLVLLHIALLWIVVAQAQMSRSWRIGIDEQHKTDLVTTGVFARSRNPVFLGMLLSLLGLFLLMPNALTLLLLVTSWVVIQIQVRLEEAFLAKQHGETYLKYNASVGRYL